MCAYVSLITVWCNVITYIHFKAFPCIYISYWLGMLFINFACMQLKNVSQSTVMAGLTSMCKSGIQEINLHLTYFSSPGNEGCRGTELISLNLWLSGGLLSLECLNFKSLLLCRGVFVTR